MKHRLCDKQNNRMELKRKGTRIRPTAYSVLKTVQENKAMMNKGEIALVQTGERKHPHFT